MATAAAASNKFESFFETTLEDADPEIAGAIRNELGRQQHEIELIASENIVSRAVLEAQGSIMTNKYAEGYPGKRYYGGCQFVDVAEELAIERAKKLFGCKFANVQPNSGSQMNQAVFLALLQPGDTFMGLDLNCRRPSDPRLAGQHVAANGSRSCPMASARTTTCSTWTRRAHRARAQAEADPRRRHRLFAHLGLEALPRDRRCGRRLSDGRHGAYRRPRRRRRASVAAAACPCGDDDHAQVAARPARRHDPDQRRGHRQEDQLGGLPRPAGRPADACHRRQGGRFRRGAAARTSRSMPRMSSPTPRRSPRRSARASISSPAAPTII